MVWEAPKPAAPELVPRDIVEEHASEAAFLWTLRVPAARSYAYNLGGLTELDERIDAHLDGLLLAGTVGRDAAFAALGEPGPGEVFAATYVALALEDMSGLASVLDVAALATDLAPAIPAAMGWLPMEHVQSVVRGLLAATDAPALQWLGLSACAAHREDPMAVLDTALSAYDVRLRARALRLAGELGRRDRRGLLPASWYHEALECRFWALWSSAILRDPTSGPELQRFVEEPPNEFTNLACEAAVRILNRPVAVDWLKALGRGSKEHVRAAIGAAGVLGDPAVVPWLISWLGYEDYARVAAGALALITNAPVEQALEGAAPEGFVAGPNDDPDDEDVAADPDEDLPWPNVDACEAWWYHHQAEFPANQRYVLGGPMLPPVLHSVLAQGHQVARAHTAIELCMRQGGQHLFNVEAPSRFQFQHLGIDSASTMASP